MKIIELPNKILRKKSLDVKLPLVKEDIEVINKMISYVDDSQKEDSKLRPGIGIAAIQLGFLKKIFYINVDYGNDQKFRDVIINPKIIASSETYVALKNGEGCLSVPEKYENQTGLVHRKNRIIVKGFSYFEQVEKEWDVNGFLAIVFQHEIDHLDGKLFIDRINKENKNEPLENEILI